MLSPVTHRACATLAFHQRRDEEVARRARWRRNSNLIAASGNRAISNVWSRIVVASMFSARCCQRIDDTDTSNRVLRTEIRRYIRGYFASHSHCLFFVAVIRNTFHDSEAQAAPIFAR